MWFYNFGLILYVWAIRLVAPRHPKARLWIEGRKDLFRRMREAIAPTDRIIWIHVASLGEFEQGRPIIEQLRKTHPEYKILLTFFSPSGYEIRKNYPYLFIDPSVPSVKYIGRKDGNFSFSAALRFSARSTHVNSFRQ